MARFELATRGLEPATYRLTADRSANWAMEAIMHIIIYTYAYVNIYIFISQPVDR